MDSPSKHSLPEELAKQKAPLQARIQELARLRQEELKDGQHDDADRLQTRVSLLTKAMDSLGRALYKIETREKGYHIALWLNKLEHCIWDFRQLKTLTSKNFQDLIARVMMLRKVGVLQATLSPAHQQADSPLAGASEAIAEGLTKLSRLEQYLRDRRVLEAVGGAAVPAPDFLQAETQPTWSLSLIPNQSLDDLEGVDQEALHEIKGLLRVGAES